MSLYINFVCAHFKCFWHFFFADMIINNYKGYLENVHKKNNELFPVSNDLFQYTLSKQKKSIMDQSTYIRCSPIREVTRNYSRGEDMFISLADV